MAKMERRENESFDAFFRRLKRSWRDNGKIKESRRRQHFTRKPSKNQTRTATVRRVQNNAKLAYLKKTGKISEDQWQV